ncbi:hypothetical protein PBT90_04740 [Algoriphagus halophytocola]|uniref:Deoxyribose-phosphate aldolase n=1 Tax=Algoriphagus halophytocola TaxID=2991499 RepID=A0ABY6MJ83_9BACT|nr:MULTISPECIES: DUF6503 family protein [unclassified Algoriphagus]UZD22726.1 hypothetical protein OM944_19000 [Algoriphagus sp. TR-M5]WBL43991.1 hypothetical protein PBT90_04740 [Algoriphagus sp. TR-M9]
MRFLTPCCFLFVFIGLASCDSRSEAEKLVDKAIAAHGGEAFESSQIEFDFRDIHYSILKTPDRFEYIREFSDSTGNAIRDLLNNEGFVRTVNGVKIDTLSEEWIGKYSRSVNSVAYFAYLPYGLNDPSVYKSLVGDTEINGEKYDLIKVTFAEEGGGEDYDDEFLYWIGKEDSYVDFLAYSYHTDGGGVRMREVSSVNEIGGIRFQNYLNFKPQDETVAVEMMQNLYESGDLELLSEINLENIRVEPLDE